MSTAMLQPKPALRTLGRKAFDVVFEQTGNEEPAYPFDHLKPRKGLYTILRRPVFQAGTWNEDPWPERKLAMLEEAHPQTVGELHPWVTINHEPSAMAAARLGADASLHTFKVPTGMKVFLGFISRAYRNTEPYETSRGHVIPPGQLYFNDLVNVAPNLALAVDRGNFLRASVGILEEAELFGRTWPVLQEHLSFEGEWEAVYTLDDLNRWYASMDGGKPSAGRRRLYTFSRGDFAMADTPTGSTAVEMAEAPPEAPAQSDNLDTRVTNLEAQVGQIATGVQNMNAMLQGIAAKMGEEVDPVQMGAKKDEKDMGADTPTTEAPVSGTETPPPALGDAAAVQQFENRVAERIRKQFSAQLTAQQQQINQLQGQNKKTASVARAESVKTFMAKHEARIEPLLRPLAQHMLEETAELEATEAGGKVKRFHHLESGKQYGLHETLKLFLSNRKPILEDASEKLVDLEAPPESDLTTGPKSNEWNKKSVHAAVKEYSSAKKISLREGLRELSKQYGPNFQRGLLRQPD